MNHKATKRTEDLIRGFKGFYSEERPNSDSVRRCGKESRKATQTRKNRDRRQRSSRSRAQGVNGGREGGERTSRRKGWLHPIDAPREK